MTTVRIATRSSAQATAQASVVADLLRARGNDAELVFVETMGDRRTDVPLHSIGGQGVFVKEVQQAVLDARADVAVHSAKDLQSATEPGLELAAFCERRTAADALVGRSLAELGPGATLATGSVRRRAQIARVRPDLRFVELRGNIHTRLSKIPEDGAIVMAVAALEILELTSSIAEVLDPAVFVPAVGQGCVAVECRDDDAEVRAALAGIDHPPTRRAVEIERAFLAELGSGCSLPVGAHVVDDTLFTFLGAADEPATAVHAAVPLTGAHDDDLDIARRAAHDAAEELASS
jgi:hydroxymethylbilane synthase